ncbi:MAG: S9 family peptidase [Alloprevotella sp.]
MNIALLSILSLAASADTLVVEKADLVSSAPLVRPYQTDSVNLKEKSFDLKEVLEKNKPFKPARVAQPAAAQVVNRGESLDCPENVAGVLRTLRFNVQTPRFVEATLSVEKMANHRVYVDGTELSGNKLSFQPGRAEIVVQALTLAEAKDSFFVSLQGENLKDVVVNATGKRPYTMKDMLLGESYSRCSMSPDGKFAVILTYLRQEDGNISYTTRLTELATGNDVFKLNGYTPYSWLEAEDHQLFFTRTNLQGRELVLFDAATRSETVLAEHIPDGNFEVSPKKNYLIFTLTEEGPASSNSLKLLRNPDDRMPGWRNRSTLWKYDLASATMSRLTYGSAGVYLSDISSDAKKLLLCYTRFDPSKMPFERRTFVEMDAYTGKVDTLLADTAFISSAIYSPDATRLLISASPASFNRLGCEVGEDMNPSAFDYRLYLYDIASRQTKPLLPGFKPSVGNYQWSRGDGQIYFVADDASGRGIFSLNPESGAVKSYRLPIECVSGFSMAVGQRKNPDFIAFGQGGERARDMVIGKLDGTTPRVKPFGPLSFEKNVGDVAVGSCRDWKFLTSRGDSIDGFFFLPPDFDATKKYPMIVYYYGGCTPSTKCLEYQYPVQVLAGQGYVVYVVNPSGCIGYGQEFAARHVNAWGKRTAEDIIEGTQQFCREHSFVDASKIGCMGASYGGFMTQYLQTRTDLFAAAVSHAGISNIASYWGGGYWGYTYGECAQYGSFPWNNPSLYVEQSPLFSADKIKTPLLLLHGTVDTNVPTNESQQLYTALKILGKEVEYVQVDGENHVIVDYKKRMAWQEVIFAWFAKHLKNDGNWWKSLRL